jgi:CHASE1-domain containing sensor protein
MLSRVNITVFISVAIGVALSFFIYFWQNQAQQKLIQEKFKTQIDKKTYEIQEGLELNMHALNSLAAYYYGSNSISRDEFHEYASVMLEMHPSIYSLQWLVKVPHELKEKFYIFEFDANGSKRSVQERQEYYPILYAEPLEQNKIAIGLDVGFEKNRRDAIIKSVETTSASMSTQINLIEEKKGVLLFYPIYKDRKTKKDILGFFLAIIQIQEIISKAINDEFFGKGIALITIKEMDGSQEGNLLFSNEYDDYTSEFYHESKIDFASKSWKIEAYASKYFVQVHSTKYPLIFLVLLLSITFILAFAIYLMLKKQEALLESNDEMRRFQNVAVTREERIAELKKIIKELQEQNGAKNV